MTDMQVKARANELKAEELRIQEAKLAEQERSNRMNEALTEAADRAKYNTVDYYNPTFMTSLQGTPLNKEGVGVKDSPQSTLKGIGDFVSWVFNPIGNLVNMLVGSKR